MLSCVFLAQEVVACQVISEDQAPKNRINIEVGKPLAESYDESTLLLTEAGLLARADLQNKPLVISGAKGAVGRGDLCKQMKAKGFKNFVFVSAKPIINITAGDYIHLASRHSEEINLIASSQSHSGLEQLDLPVKLNSFKNLPSTLKDKKCKDIVVFPGKVSELNSASNKKLIEGLFAKGCSVLLAPSMDEVAASINLHRVANLKRNQPLERYRCN